MAVVDSSALWAQAQKDSSYQAGHSGLANSIVQAILAYGDPTALDPTTAAYFGIDPTAVAAAAQNPYSTMRGIQTQQATNNQTSLNDANARNLEFSGVNSAMAGHNAQTAQQSIGQAGQSLQQTIAGIRNQDTGLITGAYQNLMTQALSDPTIPAPAAPAAPVSQPSAPVVNSTAPGALNNPIAPGGGVPFHTSAGGVTPPKPPAPPKVKAANVLVGQSARGLVGHA